MRDVLLAGVGVGLAAAVVAAVRSALARRAVRDRVFAPAPGEVLPPPPADETPGLLARWLALAGYRDPNAPAAFVAATAFTFLAAAGVAFGLSRAGLVGEAARALAAFPGGVGDIFLPAVYAGPWVAALTLALAPWQAVRAARRERVAAVEQDLPLVLELLATLGEAGLGFDAALDRILATRPADRPLVEEFRQFQRDVLAGVPRVRALRRLAARADVLSLTVLVSALVQAEQVGAGVAEVLRRQAEDLRNRRRERALAAATALPVKLMFPLVVCFLPGLFVATLGPTFFQFFQFAEQVIQNRRLR